MIDPIIITGMHRSGTTLIAKILTECGIYLGNDLDKNYESFFFQNINEWILRRLGGSWSCPKNLDYIIQNQIIFDELKSYVKEELDSFWITEYTSIKNYFLGKSKIFNNNWGWKDPRNIFTLKLWMELFPNSKIIFVYRNGIDVANSLVVRQRKFLIEERLNPFKPFGKKKKIKSYLKKIELYDYHAPDLLNINNGYELWKLYNNEFISRYMDKYENILVIKYEDAIENPKQMFADIETFLSISVSKKTMRSISSTFNKDRRYSFFKDSQLLEFFNSVKNDPINKKFGYSNIT